MERLNLKRDLKRQHNKDQHRNCRSLGRATIEWILDNIEFGSNILELGSGLGTVILSHRYKMFSVEHNPAYVGKCPHAKYIHSLLMPDRWFDPVPIVRERPEEYDLLIIDSPNKRHGLMKHLDLFDPSVPWIFDDTNVEVTKEMVEDLAKMQDRKVSYYHAGINHTRKDKWWGLLEAAK